MMMASSGNGGSGNEKIQKVSEETVEEDRISKLPDSLLIQILSLLPTRPAFTTCILSKRWRYLCTFVYNFNFTPRDSRKKKNSIPLVNYVLAHSASPKIEKLEIEISRGYKHFSLSSKFLSFAVAKNVETVVISADHETSCEFPKSFRSCSSLITLDISYCGFDCDEVISWKSLKTLKLEYLELSDDLIVKLLSGCPALETMELCRVEGFSRLEINSSKLKRLQLKAYWLPTDRNDHSLEIIAPYLQHLEISGDLYDLNCRLVDVSSVVIAKLTFKITCIGDLPFKDFDDEEDSCRNYHKDFWTLVQDYLQKLSCTSKLTVGTWFTQVMCILLVKRMPIPQLKCKYLTLELHKTMFSLYGVAGLLRASPHVETINIDMATATSDNSLCHFELRYLDKGDDIKFQSRISSFVFPNLKKVKIVISSGRCLKNPFVWEFEKFYKLSKFLLMSATALEKFIIISKRIECKKCSTNCVAQYFSGLADKLLGCPRSSTKSMIIFE